MEPDVFSCQVKVVSGESEKQTLHCQLKQGAAEVIARVTAQNMIKHVDGFRPYVLIRWGTGEFTVQAEVDVGPGVQIPVKGTRFDVFAAADPAPAAPVDGHVATILGFSEKVTATPLVRTRYIDGLQPGEEKVHAVPMFAAAVSCAAREKDSPFSVDFLDSDKEVLASSSISTSSFSNNWHVFGIGATWQMTEVVAVRIKNLGDKPLDAKLVFELVL